METTMMGYIGTALRIHSFISSKPKAKKDLDLRAQGAGLRVQT